MAMPWATVDEVKQVIADSLSKELAELQPKWGRLVDDGADGGARWDAARDIVQILLSKGFTLAQIDQWDERKTYNVDIAAHLALVKGAAANNYNQETIDKLDRRKMLAESVGIVINGVLVAPGASDDVGGGMGIGEIDDTDYRINMDTHL